MEKIESFSIEDNNNIINEENKAINDRFLINNSNLNEPLIYTKKKEKISYYHFCPHFCFININWIYSYHHY